MATVSDVTTTPLSGLNYIDALLDSGPDWNFLTDSSGKAVTTLRYTFSVASGNEEAKAAADNFSGTQQAFTVSQQTAARSAFAYISSLTGIQFVETAIGTDAQIHLANVNLKNSNETGLASWHSSYTYSSEALRTYDADVYVYLDNIEWASQNGNLVAGGTGYETLLHELGHALGLKHPFEPILNDNTATLPVSQDNTSNTLMSYTTSGGPYATFRQDDVAALMWLYGGDGLGGALGIGSPSGARYLAGTSGNDTLTGTDADDIFEGNGGNDMIYGGNGNDTAVFHGVRSNYNFSVLANGDLVVTSKDGSDGTDTLSSIETLRFTDVSISHADVVAAATASPTVPKLTVSMNGNGYISGNMPSVSGQADANATVKIYTSDNVLVGSIIADVNGLWTLKLSSFKDGLNYQVYATATDSAGHVSSPTDLIKFNVDATPPVIPTSTLSYTQGSNQATIGGNAEAGTTITLIDKITAIAVAQTKVGSDGTWSITTSPLPNGSYNLVAVSTDLANATSANTTLSFNVASAANTTGTAGNDKLTAGTGNNAIDGQGGIDTVIYNGPRANFTVAKELWGYGVTDNVGTGGHDALINVERLHFSDADVALDVSGTGGQVFRLYQAAFDRAAEPDGLGFWIMAMDKGQSLEDMAKEFIKSAESVKLYGSNPTTSEFVTNLYYNVLHRAPEAGGFNFWVDAIDHQGATREHLLAFFSESPENQAQVIGSIQNGMTYVPHT